MRREKLATRARRLALEKPPIEIDAPYIEAKGKRGLGTASLGRMEAAQVACALTGLGAETSS